MPQFVIVVGELITGVDRVYGPFPTEAEAREWGHGYSGEDRFEQTWFSMPLSDPDDEEV